MLRRRPCGRWRASTSARSSGTAARLRRSLAAGSQLCAVVKSDAYGHGAVPAARAALAGGATTLGVATAAEAAELRDAPAGRADPDDGRALGCRARAGRCAPGSEIAAWRRDFRSRGGASSARRSGSAPASTSSTTAAWAASARPTRRPSSTRAHGRRRPAAGARRVLDPFRHRRRARGPRQPALRRAARPLPRARRPGSRAGARGASCTRPTRRRRCATRPPTSTWSAAASRSTASTRSAPTPRARASSPRWSSRSYVAEVKTFAAGASAGYGRRWSAAQETRVGVLPIGYGDGVRRALTNNADVLVGGRRVPARRHGLDGQHHRRPRARAPMSSAGAAPS